MKEIKLLDESFVSKNERKKKKRKTDILIKQKLHMLCDFHKSSVRLSS